MRTTIQTAISALAELEELRYVADDAGQGDMVTTPGTQPFSCPAVLVAADSASPSEHRTKDTLRECVQIGIRLYDAPGVVANAKAPGAHSTASLRIYDMRNSIIRRLEEIGFRYVKCSRIRREDGMRELLITFEKTIVAAQSNSDD